MAPGIIMWYWIATLRRLDFEPLRMYAIYTPLERRRMYLWMD